MDGKLHKAKSCRLIVKICHVCNKTNESFKELQKCNHCGKGFLPLNYFDKIHDQSSKYEELFADSQELHEEELIRGIYVLW